MPDTQLEIKKYVESRKLNSQSIASLITKRTLEYKKASKCCPRCGTNKLLINNVEWTETYGKIGYEDEVAARDGLMGKATYKDEIICNVCDFWLQDPNKRAPKPKGKKPSIFRSFINGILDSL
ncbi:hypothetical protein [Flavobacterium sp. 102]|uniref:hypothetical protein n=1 Tax=Flavobacterium sp. 102 TaxID=2135623 RepID=UPI000EB56E73|nr:hypothetical protein [Flavobacterium sp. 102]RKS02847.1 hypothetical protein C8C84_2577 [Flavobacterium sp. 102]